MASTSSPRRAAFSKLLMAPATSPTFSLNALPCTWPRRRYPSASSTFSARLSPASFASPSRNSVARESRSCRAAVDPGNPLIASCSSNSSERENWRTSRNRLSALSRSSRATCSSHAVAIPPADSASAATAAAAVCTLCLATNFRVRYHSVAGVADTGRPAIHALRSSAKAWTDW